ncbi:PREDICTED: uncharacterized protein LOC109348184 isoform X1 [Lupinus angustifolius]|uniref:uncharacterized protein LOC109348184 isoform X1 n=1 Tax=Lupinus angustifolius TaxID=3871 RepID=UPI00092FA112|nr:PREDICTED: uncharacterized protein LOC109348184 isoform X1 [Lupinus angustifolius]
MRGGSVDFFMDSVPVDFDIEEKELQIENQLPWETYPLTPFYFLDYFYPPLEETGGFRRRGINEIIVQAQADEEFITYKPSHIAFSSLAAAADIIYPTIEIPGVTERIATGLALWLRIWLNFALTRILR